MQRMSAFWAVVDTDGRIAMTDAAWNGTGDRDATGSSSQGGGLDYLAAIRDRTAIDDETVRAIQAGIEGVRAKRLGHFEFEYGSSSEGFPQRYLLRAYPIPSASRLIVVHEEMSAETTACLQQGETSRSAAMGALSGGLAHELNNCLTAMLGFGELALSSLPSTTHAHGYLQQVVMAARRGRDLVTELLAFSRHRDTKRQLISPHVLLKETVRVFKSALQENIELRTAIPTSTRRVEADPHELHCLFVSLLASAEHALEADGGVLEVRLEDIQPDHPLRVALPSLIANSYVRLTVTNEERRHNPGVEPDTQSTSRATAGHPERLDLNTFGGMIDRQGGAIRILDQPEGRTLVEVYLLAKQESA